jgi:hypothetical protein
MQTKKYPAPLLAWGYLLSVESHTDGKERGKDQERSAAMQHISANHSGPIGNVFLLCHISFSLLIFSYVRGYRAF